MTSRWVDTRPVPLQPGELGIREAAGLFVAEGFADLIDGPAAGGQQPLHGVFRGGLQKQRLAVGGARAHKLSGKAVQVFIRHSGR